MCTPSAKRKGAEAKKVWNHWLDERDRAPGELLADWLKEKTQEGLEVAAQYAQAGLEVAKARAEVAAAGRALLDNSGDPAREALRLKQLCARAVAADADVAQRLRYFSSTYREEASFSTAAEFAEIYSGRSKLFGQAKEAWGNPPPAPTMTLVERDASAIMQIGEATALVGRQLSVTPANPESVAIASAGGGIAGGGSPSNRRSASSPASTSAASAAAHRQGVEELLAELFRLQDLNGNGQLEEEELIKLNEKIAVLHYGKGSANKAKVREKFTAIFRERLDPEGRPVAYPAFRAYMLQALEDIDRNERAQEMIVEQFIAEAESARAAFQCPSLVSASDAEFLAFLDKGAQGAGRGGAAASESTQSPSMTPSSAATASPPAKEEPIPALSDARAAQPLAPASRGISMADRVAAAQATTKKEQPETAAPPLPPPSAPASTAPSSSVSAAAAPAAAAASGAGAPRQAADSRQTSAQSVRELTGGYVKGDRVEVWSNTKKQWMDGVVEEAFEVTREAEGYMVPAGTLKVSSGSATKWIRPGQSSTVLRRPKPRGGGYAG